jgi:hypothetical protein
MLWSKGQWLTLSSELGAGLYPSLHKRISGVACSDSGLRRQLSAAKADLTTLQPGCWAQLRDWRAYRLLALSEGRPSRPLSSAILFNAAYRGLSADIVGMAPYTAGLRSQRCGICKARYWEGESPNLCCDGGKVNVPVGRTVSRNHWMAGSTGWTAHPPTSTETTRHASTTAWPQRACKPSGSSRPEATWIRLLTYCTTCEPATQATLPTSEAEWTASTNRRHCATSATCA